MDQCWSEAFEQVWTLTWVPLVVEPLGSVRHRPWKASTYSPLEFRDHSWFRWPLQASITSLVPVPPQVLSGRHFPTTWSSPFCWRSEEHTSELQSRLHLVC